jgi:hypothetical protein
MVTGSAATSSGGSSRRHSSPSRSRAAATRAISRAATSARSSRRPMKNDARSAGTKPQRSAPWGTSTTVTATGRFGRGLVGAPTSSGTVMVASSTPAGRK